MGYGLACTSVIQHLLTRYKNPSWIPDPQKKVKEQKIRYIYSVRI